MTDRTPQPSEQPRTRAKGKPRRTVALGPPHDDGRVPPRPKPETVDDRLTRLERMLERLEDTVAVIKSLRP